MRKAFLALTFIILGGFCGMAARADFGDASFPVETFKDGPKSYHDAWCRRIKNKCRVRFAGPSMSVEGQGGILSDRFISLRTAEDGNEYYTYLTYKNQEGQRQTALFLFANYRAHVNFLGALVGWRKQKVDDLRSNYRLPASQGPQETHGRDKGLNPYDSSAED